MCEFCSSLHRHQSSFYACAQQFLVRLLFLLVHFLISDLLRLYYELVLVVSLFYSLQIFKCMRWTKTEWNPISILRVSWSFDTLFFSFFFFSIRPLLRIHDAPFRGLTEALVACVLCARDRSEQWEYTRERKKATTTSKL